MALLKTARTIVSKQTRTAGGAAVRGTLDLKDKYGGILTLRIINGGTGPSTQCTGKVLIAHNAVLPAAAAAGDDWKTLVAVGGGTASGATTEFPVIIDLGVMALEVEFDGNVGQDVTVEAFMSEVTTV